jgi:hypothetical protein
VVTLESTVIAFNDAANSIVMGLEAKEEEGKEEEGETRGL